MYYNEKDQIIIESDDKCHTCKHFNEDKPCPLLEALSLGAVCFDEELSVKNCSWYSEKVRHLKIVKED